MCHWVRFAATLAPSPYARSTFRWFLPNCQRASDGQRGSLVAHRIVRSGRAVPPPAGQASNAGGRGRGNSRDGATATRGERSMKDSLRPRRGFLGAAVAAVTGAVVGNVTRAAKGI